MIVHMFKEEAEVSAKLCLESNDQLGAITSCISDWMDIAALNQRNADYYRSLIVRCGLAIGKEAFTADDGITHRDVLCAKVPELVEKVVGE